MTTFPTSEIHNDDFLKSQQQQPQHSSSSDLKFKISVLVLGTPIRAPFFPPGAPVPPTPPPSIALLNSGTAVGKYGPGKYPIADQC